MVLQASGVREQLQVASPKVRENGRGLVRKCAQTGCNATACEGAATHCSSREGRAESWCGCDNRSLVGCCDMRERVRRKEGSGTGESDLRRRRCAVVDLERGRQTSALLLSAQIKPGPFAAAPARCFPLIDCPCLSADSLY